MRKQKIREKNLKKNKFSVITILFIFVCVYFVYTFMTQQMQINRYNSQIDMYKTDIANKEVLSNYYNDKEKSVESDEYIEEVARETLGLVKPYEKIFIDVNK